jgi:tetratricopeptide (TPR) repeat protein
VRIECNDSPICSADHSFPETEFNALVWTIQLAPVEGYAHDANGNLQHVVMDESGLLNYVLGASLAGTGRYVSSGEILAAADSLWAGDPAPLLRLGAEGYYPKPGDMGEATFWSAGAVVKAAEDYDWRGSDAEFQRAFELDSNYASAHHWYGYMLMYRGQAVEASAEIQKGYRLDPLNPALMNAVTAVLEVSGKYQEALLQARKQLKLDPHSYYAHWAMGDIYTSMGKYDDAVASYRSTLAITPGNPGIVARLSYALGMEGHRTDALKLLSEVEQSHKGKYLSPALESWVYAGLGDRPRALQELDRAYRDRSIGVLMLRDPHFDSLRSEPRFKEIAKRAGLD